MTKRLIVSLALIALTLAGVTGATIAYFSDTVQVTGITIAMGTADLEMSYQGNEPSNYQDGPITLDLNLSGLYPGVGESGSFWLRNVSQSPIALRPFVRLTSAGGDWDALKNKIEVRITDKGHDGSGTYSWGWRDLEWWNSERRTISDTNGT